MQRKVENSSQTKTDDNQLPLDPFDPKALRISPDESSSIGVRKHTLSIRVGKPNKMEFVRCHASEDYRLNTCIIEDQANREVYLVSQNLREELPEFITPVRLCVAITRHGSPFIWMAKLPSTDGMSRGNPWHTTMLTAQELAIDNWIRVQADQSAGCYNVVEAMGRLPDPHWPKDSFSSLLKLAFRDNYIDSIDHAFCRSLRGEL